VTIGSLNITIPALITAISGLILGIILAFKINMYMGLILLPVILIAAYNVNCAIVGHCTTWAWILTGVYMLYVLMVSVMMLVVSNFAPGVLSPKRV